MNKQSRKSKKGQVIKIVLGIIAVAGVIGVAAVVPNALVAFAHLGVFRRSRRSQREFYARKTLHKLEQQKLIEITKEHRGAGRVRLTGSGERALSTYQLADISVPHQKRWDRKWRVVSFDVSQGKTVTRNRLRQALRNVGFVYLQRSVWVFPYPCREVIDAMAKILSLSGHIIYMTVEELRGTPDLRKRFPSSWLK